MVLVLMASVAVLILVFITNPALLDKFWLWLIGLAGYVIALLEKGYQTLSSVYKERTNTAAPDTPPSTSGPPPQEDIQAKVNSIDERLANIEKRLIKEEIS